MIHFVKQNSKDFLKNFIDCIWPSFPLTINDDQDDDLVLEIAGNYFLKWQNKESLLMSTLPITAMSFSNKHKHLPYAVNLISHKNNV